jgi:hypothetical protein
MMRIHSPGADNRGDMVTNMRCETCGREHDGENDRLSLDATGSLLWECQCGVRRAVADALKTLEERGRRDARRGERALTTAGPGVNPEYERAYLRGWRSETAKVAAAQRRAALADPMARLLDAITDSASRLVAADYAEECGRTGLADALHDLSLGLVAYRGRAYRQVPADCPAHEGWTLVDVESGESRAVGHAVIDPTKCAGGVLRLDAKQYRYLFRG